MAFYKKVKAKVDGKWYPRSITVGKPVSTAQVAKRISAECTVNPADVTAVLTALGGVLGDYMSEGRTVKLNGVGTFYYTANASGNGVAAEADVSATQIADVRIRFIPERFANSSHKTVSRAFVSNGISWNEWGKEPLQSEGEEGGGDIVDPTA